MTRPKKIETPEILLEYFNEYVSGTKEKPIKKQIFVGRDGAEKWEERERPLTMVGFKNFCYKNKGCCIDRYVDKLEYPEFNETVAYIKNTFLQDNIEGAMAGIYQPGITARINSLTDKSEVKSTNENRNININVVNTDVPLASNEGEIKLD